MSFLKSIRPYDPLEKYRVSAVPPPEKDVPTVVFKPKYTEPKPEHKTIEKEAIPPIPEKIPVLERQQAVIVEPQEKKKGPKNPRFKAGTEEAKEWSKMMIGKRKEAKERKLKIEQEVTKSETQPNKVDENENLVFKSK